MTEPQPVKTATEEEGKSGAGKVEPAVKKSAAANASPATKGQERSGLRSQGVVEVAPAEKPAFVRAYNKAPNLDRPFDAVDMDESGNEADSTPLVTGPVIKPTEAERTRMPAEKPPTLPTPPREPRDKGQKAVSEDAEPDEAADVEKVPAAASDIKE